MLSKAKSCKAGNIISRYILFILLLSGTLYSQVDVALKLPVTGLSSVIKFKLFPYTGDYITGITVSEISGSSYNYVASGFDAQTIQLTKLYINDVLQSWWGRQFTGNPFLTFPDLTSTQTISGLKTFTAAIIHTGAETHSGAEVFTNVIHFNAGIHLNDFPLQHVGTPTVSTDGANKSYVDGILGRNNTWTNQNTWTNNNYMPYLHIGDGIGTGIVLDGSATITGSLYAMLPHYYVSDTSITPIASDAIWKGYADAHYLTGTSTGSYTTLPDYKLRRTSTNKQLFDIGSTMSWSTSSGLSWNTVQRYAQFDSLTIAHVDTTDASDNYLQKLITIERLSGVYRGALDDDWYVHYKLLTNGSVTSENTKKLTNTCEVMWEADSSGVTLDGSLKTYAEITVPIGMWDVRIEYEYEFDNGASTFDYYDSIYSKIVYQPTTVLTTKTVKFGSEGSRKNGMQGSGVISAQINATSLKWIRFQALCSLDADNLNRRIKKYKIIFTRIY